MTKQASYGDAPGTSTEYPNVLLHGFITGTTHQTMRFCPELSRRGQVTGTGKGENTLIGSGDVPAMSGTGVGSRSSHDNGATALPDQSPDVTETAGITTDYNHPAVTSRTIPACKATEIGS